MQKLVRDYLNELNRKQKKRRRAGIAALLLVVLVVGAVIGTLTQYGVAMTGNPICGIEEHQHSAACYTKELACGQAESEGHTHTDACYTAEKQLTCTQEENEEHSHDDGCYTETLVLTCTQEESEGHQHTDGCYTETFSCGKEEHQHTDACYAEEPDTAADVDTSADLEDSAVWDAQYADTEWKEIWSEDLVTAARVQLGDTGYKESEKNYTETEDGSRKGYTRYGQFIGDVYRDWNVAFVNFCMYYAGMTASGIFPDEMAGSPAPELYPEGLTDSAKWIEEFKKINEQDEKYEKYLACLTEAEGYEPAAGDIVFFEKEKEDGAVLADGTREKESWMGIVSSYNKEENKIKAIEGDSEDQVKENEYNLTDAESHIARYLKISELQAVYKEEAEENVEKEPEVEDTEDVPEKTVSQPQQMSRMSARDADPSTEESKEHTARITGFTITRTVDGTAPFDNHKQHTEKCYETGHNGNPEYLTCKQHIYKDDKEESIAGDDRGADNLVVRTFDSVNYKFRATMDLYEKEKVITEARVKIQVILPATKEQAAFNLGAMTWVDTTPEYEAKIEDIILDENGGFSIAESKDDSNINGQLLTCWKHLEGGRAVIPGFFENNVSVDVKNMKNGATFAPTFYAVLENGYEYDITDGTKVPKLNRGEGEDAKNPEKNDYVYADEHKCPTENHKEIEMFRADAPEIKVSAAPKYNIRVAGGDSERRQYNFQDGVEEDAVNYDKGYKTGRMMRLGVTIQLYNDNASKGLKGIQLPDEDKAITFDLELDSKYRINDPNPPAGYYQNQEIAVTDEYTPLLWSCGPNDRNSSYGKVNTDGRTIYDGYWGDGLAPYSDGGGEHGCQDSGEWTATQENNTIHVTVSGYKVDVTNMPSYNRGQDTEVDNVTYGPHIGCFSSGVLWILQPFNNKDETDIEENEGGNRDPKFDVVAKYGTGVFDTTINEKNMRITTSDVSSTIVVGNEKQMCKTDDRSPHNLELLLPGVMINRVRYSDKDISKGVGVKSIRNGRDYASLGSEIWLMGGFTYYADRKEENQFYYGTSLTKFYGKAIEPVEDVPIEGQWTATAEGEGGNYVPDHSHLQTYFGGGARAADVGIYYAAKENGADWENDKELEETYEDDLIFYKHMDDLKKAGKICVGILYCYKGAGLDVMEETNDPAYECFHKAIVKSDDTLLGDGNKPVTFAMASTSRVWTKQMFDDETWNENGILDRLPVWTAENGVNHAKLSDFPGNYMKSGNIKDSTWYQRTQYYDDGRGVSKDHNSDWSHWGDTLLLIGYKTYITKNLMQKVGGEDKQVFDLDGNQRVVDFKLTPSTGYNLAISQGEGSNPNITIPVITIVDTLPKYLKYREGSAYTGGTYKQTAANGGRQGEIVGGTQLDDPEIEQLVNDADETIEALAWNISKPSSVDNEPVIIEAEDGTQTLIWRFYNREVGDRLPVIYYSADIGDRGNALTDVPEGTTNLVNKVRITAKLDRRHPSVENGNYAEVGIAVTKGSAGAYGKYSLQNAVEEDGNIDYVVYYDNNQDNEIPVALMDNMPFNGVNGNKFTGTYKLTDWKLDRKLCEKSELTVWYTTDTKYKELTLSDKDSQKNPVITIDEKNGWKKACVAEDGTVSCEGLDFEKLEFGKTDEQFLAWAVTGTLAGGNCIDVSLSIQLIPEKPTVSDSVSREIYHYVNLFSTKDTITETDTPTVRRTLEGLTWMDYNRNGKQDQHQNEDEEKLSNVKVTLLKLKDVPDETISEEEWAKDISHYEPVYWPIGTGNGKDLQPVTICTGQQVSLRQSDGKANSYEPGRYKFTDLPAGYFAVRFTPGDGEADISKMRATIYDCMGNTADEIDSDGVPVYEGNDEKNGKLKETYIPQIEMEDADTIFYKKYPDYTQTSPYHDSGFYYNPQLNLHKVGENWTTQLTGASFILSDAQGNVMTFTKEDGVYIAPIDLGGGVTSRARYYIQYADDSQTGGETYVAGCEPTENENGMWIKLFKKKANDESQLFELFSHTDGSFSFRQCATGRWIDLDGGQTDDKTAIHLWEDGNVPTTNENQKWYVTPNGNGQYRIQAAPGRRAGNKGFMDLSNNSVIERGQIWGYTGNDTTAQNWRLVPENENSNLKVDANGHLTIKDLLPGEYTLTELETPPGCALPDHPVKIIVNKDGTITTTETGDTSKNISKVEGTSNSNGTVTNDVKIRNFELYTLPSTGGNGIYWYIIGGTLLMMAGVLILYKKRMREEVLYRAKV